MAENMHKKQTSCTRISLVTRYHIKDTLQYAHQAMYLKLLTALLLSAFTWAAGASSFRISPLMLTFDPSHNRVKTRMLTLTNTSTQDVVVKIYAKQWQQIDGKDVYTDTKDLFFAPPVVTIPPGRKQVVPVRIKVGAHPTQERSYRVYLEQMPSLQPTGGAGMSFRARFGVPVFIAPVNKPFNDPEFLVRQLSERDVELTIRNQTHRHLRLEHLELHPEVLTRNAEGKTPPIATAPVGQPGSSYLLPGVEAKWRFSSPKSIDAGNYKIWIFTGDNTRSKVATAPDGTWAIPVELTTYNPQTAPVDSVRVQPLSTGGSSDSAPPPQPTSEE